MCVSGNPISVLCLGNSLFDFESNRLFLLQNALFRTRIDLGATRNCGNSLYFSLLAGNSRSEQLAPDCFPRHTVCEVKKADDSPGKIARNRRIDPIVAIKPDWRKLSAGLTRRALAAFFSGQHSVSPLSGTLS